MSGPIKVLRAHVARIRMTSPLYIHTGFAENLVTYGLTYGNTLLFICFDPGPATYEICLFIGIVSTITLLVKISESI